MLERYFLACSFFSILNICPLKGADVVSNLQTILLQPPHEQVIATHELLEEDIYYQKLLPQSLGSKFKPSGTYKTAYFVLPNHFHPFLSDALVNSLWDLCTGSLSQLKVGQYETMAPNLADSIIEKQHEGGVSYAVTLKNNLYWQPVSSLDHSKMKLGSKYLKSTQVTAYDFKLYVQAFKNPGVYLPRAATLRKQYQYLKEIEVIDDHHFIVHWTVDKENFYLARFLTGQLKPLPVFVYESDQSGKIIFPDLFDAQVAPLFAKEFCDHWSKGYVFSCGPWIFQKDQEHRITLTRNPNFPSPYAALFEKMEWIYKASPTHAWQAFKNDELTSCLITPMQLEDYHQFLKSRLYLKQKELGHEVNKIDYFSKLYYFIGWNQKHPIFKSEKVRNALTMAINRKELIDHFLKGAAKELTGPFMPDSKAYDSTLTPLAYNPKLALKLLQQEGWNLSSKGYLEKEEEGKSYALRFHLSYFLNNELARAICEYIATSLKEIKVECIPQGLNYVEFMDRYGNKNFDALYMGWALAPPPENPTLTWHSTQADVPGSLNIVGFSDAKIDQYLDQLQRTFDPTERQRLCHLLHQRIYQLQPYTFLYVPEQIFCYRSPLKNVFIPNKTLAEATIEEPCPRIFYFQNE